MASGTRTPLHRDRIVDAALALIDEHGIDALTMRRLGRELGFEAMAIYKHVEHREALLDLVVARVYEEMGHVDRTASWETQLREIADRLRAAALAHPHLFVRLVTRPPAHPAVAAQVDATLHALRLARDDADFVVEQFWFFLGYTTGALLGETSAMLNEASMFATDPDDIPHCPALAEFGKSLAECDFGPSYSRGVESTIAAIGSAATRR